MTRKSARYIGEECRDLSKKLDQKVNWLRKKINRKIYQNHNIKIYDSYYDVHGVYLIFKQFGLLTLPYRPPETVVVDIGTVWSAVSEAAMVPMNRLTVSMNCNWKNNDCFMIYIPFELYRPENRMRKYLVNGEVRLND